MESVQNDDFSSMLNFIKINKLIWEKTPSMVCIYYPFEDSDMIAPLVTFLENLGLKITFDDFTNANFIIVVGTNNTNLALSLIVQEQNTKPILSLSIKKKGFISNINFSDYKEVIPRVMSGDCWILPRSRLQVKYYGLKEVKTYSVLNEIAINRDPLSNSLLINCKCYDFGFSQIKGDGIIISTSTGSTAYNTAAGGPLIHPLLPAFLLTPICVLSLSARPILFPSSAVITISLEPGKKECKSYIAIDGNIHIPFVVGEKVEISLSQDFYNSIILDKSFKDWYCCLESVMGWNQRKAQKPLSKD